MGLEAVMICLDNSEWSRNGDFRPTRFDAQVETINSLSQRKLDSHPESTVGLLTMGGRIEVHTSPTRSAGLLMTAMSKNVAIQGESNLLAGLKTAALALKNRQNKNQRQRIIAFVASPVKADSQELVKLGKMFKKNNVAVDIVNFGHENASNGNVELLEEFVQNVNATDNSHLVNVPAGPHNLADLVLTSPIVGGGTGTGAAARAGGAAGAGAAGAGAVGAGAAGAGAAGAAAAAAGFGMDDPDMDPDLLLAMRMSLQEELERQNRQAAAAGAGAPPAPGAAPAAAAAAADVVMSSAADDDEDDEAVQMARAIELSMAAADAAASASASATTPAPASSSTTSSAAAATTTTSSSAAAPAISMDEINQAMSNSDFIDSLLESVGGTEDVDALLNQIDSSSTSSSSEEKKDEKKQ